MTRFRARRKRRTGRILLTIAGAGLWLLVLAVPAFAHVTISPGAVPQGSTAELTFKVPNEESKADVTELQLQVPTDHPIAQFLVKPVPGWSITVHSVTLANPLVTDDGSFTTAVSEVTWTGGKIPPGEYQDFSVSADPLPTGISQLVFKAIQTYSNGDVVRWIDMPQPGQPEPEHPAPILSLTPAAASDGSMSDGSMTDGTGTGGTGTGTTAAGGSGDTTALALGAAGLVAGLLGLAAGGSVWLRGRAGGRHGASRPWGGRPWGGRHLGNRYEPSRHATRQDDTSQYDTGQFGVGQFDAGRHEASHYGASQYDGGPHEDGRL